jgi:histone H3/H4
MKRRAAVCLFPVSKIKQIMQQDDDVGRIDSAVPVMMSKAVELFVRELVTAGADVADEQDSVTLNLSHIRRCVLQQPRFDFLKDIVKEIPDEELPKESVRRGKKKDASTKAQSKSSPDERRSRSATKKAATPSTSKPSKSSTTADDNPVKSLDQSSPKRPKLSSEPSVHPSQPAASSSSSSAASSALFGGELSFPLAPQPSASPTSASQEEDYDAA